MSEFYKNLANVATQLITNFGRDIQILKLSRIPTVTDKPWRGTEPATETLISVKGAIVGFDDDLVDGDLIRRSDLDCWIPAVPGQDVSTFDFVIDEDTRYKIMDNRTIRLGTVTVAYRLQLRA